MSEEKSELEKGIEKETAIKKLRASIIRKVEDFDPTAIPLFVGKVGDVHRAIYKTAMTYTALQEALEEQANNTKPTRDAKALQVRFDELVAENFPDMGEEELVPMLVNYMTYVMRTADRLLMREENLEITERDNLSNTVPGKENTRIGTVHPIIPQRNNELSVRDRMRRNLRGARNEPDKFNIILLNSLILMRVVIPTAPDLIRLINTIVTRLRDYGERFNVNSLQLERAGITELLIDFVLDRIDYHSVKDVADVYELKQYILANDINAIVMSLLCLTAPKGVSFRMYCVANFCQHNDIQVVDPTTMIIDIEEDMPRERLDVLYEIVNKARKLSREELAKYRPIYNDPEGNPIDAVIPITGVGRMNIEIPTLDQYFGTYAAMRDRINPDLRELAIEFPNQRDFKEKRKEYMSGIRGSEYTQWIGSIEYDPEPGKEGEIEVITRDTDPRSFEEGLLDIFSEDEELYMDTLQRLIKTIPRMTYTFVGIPNDACPSCEKVAEGEDRTLISGFTPIDPVMNFFDRTRMMIGIREETSNTIEENLS